MNRISLIFLVLFGLSGPLYSGNRLLIENKSNTPFTDKSFVVRRNQLSRVPPALLPVVSTRSGENIPAQVDDLNQDGQWDELAFVCNLAPNEKLELILTWVPASELPSFPIRTNVRFGKMISPGKIVGLTTDMHGKYNLPRGKGYPYQMDGVAWENDKMGFRHYFDGRNVRDIFGKRVASMVLDTVGIMPDGSPGDTYHVLRPWGRDVMNGAQALGLGGIALQLPDTLIRLGVLRSQTTDNVDSTRYTLLTEGPVRSVFQLDFYGWEVGNTKVNLTHTVTIWAGQYGYENRVKTSPLPANSYLVTGIVNSLNTQPYISRQSREHEIRATHDKQTYAKEWVLGMGILLPKRNWAGEFEAPKTGNGISTSWCFKLKSDKNNEVRYDCYAVWELNDARFAQRDAFIDVLDTASATKETKQVTLRIIND